MRELLLELGEGSDVLMDLLCRLTDASGEPGIAFGPSFEHVDRDSTLPSRGSGDDAAAGAGRENQSDSVQVFGLDQFHVLRVVRVTELVLELGDVRERHAQHVDGWHVGSVGTVPVRIPKGAVGVVHHTAGVATKLESMTLQRGHRVADGENLANPSSVEAMHELGELVVMLLRVRDQSDTGSLDSAIRHPNTLLVSQVTDPGTQEIDSWERPSFRYINTIFY